VPRVRMRCFRGVDRSGRTTPWPVAAERGRFDELRRSCSPPSLPSRAAGSPSGPDRPGAAGRPVRPDYVAGLREGDTRPGWSRSTGLPGAGSPRHPGGIPDGREWRRERCSTPPASSTAVGLRSGGTADPAVDPPAGPHPRRLTSRSRRGLSSIGGGGADRRPGGGTRSGSSPPCCGAWPGSRTTRGPDRPAAERSNRATVPARSGKPATRSPKSRWAVRSRLVNQARSCSVRDEVMSQSRTARGAGRPRSPRSRIGRPPTAGGGGLSRGTVPAAPGDGVDQRRHRITVARPL